MAGSEGSPRRRTAKSVEAAAATGQQAPLRRCSTKRKAAVKESASGRIPRPRASGTKGTASACAEVEKAAGAKTNRMPAKDIRWILSQKPEAPPKTYQDLKRSNPELVPRPGEEGDKRLCGLYTLARAFYEEEERMPKLQEWVRGELKSKGYVEVDDGWFKRRAEAQASLDRYWLIIKAKIDELWGPDESETDSESEEEDEEDALDSVMKDFM